MYLFTFFSELTAELGYPHVLQNCQEKRVLQNKSLAKSMLELDEMDMFN